MDALRAALGASSAAGVGDAVHASLGDARALDGVIDYSAVRVGKVQRLARGRGSARLSARSFVARFHPHHVRTCVRALG
jgi:hypothetical protein